MKPMIKICVFSDSHGSPACMIAALEREKPSLCFFLGDGERDLPAVRERFPALPIYAVRGNCDLRSELPREMRCAVGGAEIFAAHGHLYNVKYDPALTELRAAAGQARVLLYGHTHLARCEEIDGQLVMNPGPAGRAAHPGYGLLLIEGGTVRAELRRL